MTTDEERIRIPKQSLLGMLVLTFVVAAVIGMIGWSVWDAFVHPARRGIELLDH